MFKELYDIAKEKQSVTLIATNEGEDKLRLVIIPKGKDGEEPALNQPFTIVDTPDNLEESFCQQVAEYRAVCVEVGNNLSEIKANAKAAEEAAKKAAESNAATKTAKKSAKKSSKKTAPSEQESEAVKNVVPATEKKPEKIETGDPELDALFNQMES